MEITGRAAIGSGLIFVGFLIALCGWIYSIQRRRYREAAKVAAQLWSGDLIQPS